MTMRLFYCMLLLSLMYTQGIHKYNLNIDSRECRHAYKSDTDNLKSVSRKYKVYSNRQFHSNTKSLQLSEQIPYVYEDIHEQVTRKKQMVNNDSTRK